MKINIVLDDELIAKAQRLTGIKNTQILVDNSLRFFVSLENQKKLIELWGKVKVDDKLY